MACTSGQLGRRGRAAASLAARAASNNENEAALSIPKRSTDRAIAKARKSKNWHAEPDVARVRKFERVSAGITRSTQSTTRGARGAPGPRVRQRAVTDTNNARAIAMECHVAAERIDASVRQRRRSSATSPVAPVRNPSENSIVFKSNLPSMIQSTPSGKIGLRGRLALSRADAALDIAPARVYRADVTGKISAWDRRKRRPRAERPVAPVCVRRIPHSYCLILSPRQWTGNGLAGPLGLSARAPAEMDRRRKHAYAVRLNVADETGVRELRK